MMSSGNASLSHVVRIDQSVDQPIVDFTTATETLNSGPTYSHFSNKVTGMSEEDKTASKQASENEQSTFQVNAECKTIALYKEENQQLRQLLDVAELGFISRHCKKIRIPPAPLVETLLVAIRESDVDLTNRLIRGSWELNILGEEGRGPLHVAALAGNKAICQSLTFCGAKLTFKDKDGLTAAHLAASAQKLDEFYEAIREEFLSAATGNDEEMIKRLIVEGWNVNDSSRHGLTALHKAAGQGHKFLCKILLENDADLHAKDVENETAVDKANAKGQYGVVEYLLSKGADFHEGYETESLPRRIEESKTPSPLSKTMTRLSSLRFWDKQRKEKSRRGNMKMTDVEDGQDATPKIDDNPDHQYSLSPEPKRNPLSLLTPSCREFFKSLDFSGRCGPQSPQLIYDDSQCCDDEHHLWGQFLDPARRRHTPIIKRPLTETSFTGQCS